MKNVLDSKQLDKRAEELRKATAIDLSLNPGNWLRSQWATSSHFAPYQDNLPLASGKDAITFCVAVTDSTLRNQVLPLTDPFLVAFLAAKVIEQTYYKFFDPSDPSVLVENLSVAKHFGTFFTPPEIAERMSSQLVDMGSISTLLDPCVGSGSLLCAPLIFGHSARVKKLVGIELDPQLARWAQMVLARVAELTSFDGDIQITQGDGLDFLVNGSIQTELTTLGVLINPPYGRLRVTRDRATNAETRLGGDNDDVIDQLAALIDGQASRIREDLSPIAHGSGVLELSKLFFVACAGLANRGASVSIIGPDSWMSGHAGLTLRKLLIENRLIERISLIREDTRKFSTVNQATAITALSPKPKTLFWVERFDDPRIAPHEVPYDLWSDPKRDNFAIPKATGTSLEIFLKLSAYKQLRELEGVINRRGELDQTSCKALFKKEHSAIRLVRGEHIERFALMHFSSAKKPSFVSENAFHLYLASKPKYRDFAQTRIAGRQCSYALQKRRLVFCRVPPNHALGNSCNYLAVNLGDPAQDEHMLSILLGILNSAVLDWYFRVENSNNHVANFEIDALPFPTCDVWLPEIVRLVSLLEAERSSSRASSSSWLNDLLEAVVACAYGLDPDRELPTILNSIEHPTTERVVNYARQLARGTRLRTPDTMTCFFNHAEPTLSALDRQVIRHVPEGGNWQQIPASVPSKRLEQIRKMTAERGVVRTTYYGRLRRDQPAYTINTYFNRPGNGTHIHPVLDRTLTSREAARLQSFPDSYIFLGNDGAVRNQIGNAVPPMLAAAIGRKFAPSSRPGTCVDVFCGAGGLSLGLEAIGWNVVAAIDNDKAALETYCFNRPCLLEPTTPVPGLTSVFNRDLHDYASCSELIARIHDALAGAELDLLVGGPPCQGFSHAGFRLKEDKRNDLAAAYLQMADQLRPTVFLLENVEGLLTFKNGAVVQEICQTLRELGYRVHEPVWKLFAEQFGAPQMRRRVFIIGSLDPSIDLSPPEPTHAKCPGRRQNGTADDLFESALLRPNTVADALAGLSLPDQASSKDLMQWLMR